MNRRKIFGTVIGLIFWSICIMFFTYAYYDWKSNPTNVVLGIEDLSVECFVGAEVSATNIGPVLSYQDGVKAEFSIDNSMTESMAIELYLDITSISDNLLTESLKYVLVADATGGTNYDYNNPVRTGDFSNFSVGNNLVTQDLEVTADVTTNYQFIIYIDGNMYNDPNMQENSLTANLMIGNCGGDAVSMNELVYQAIYSETDNSLTFVHRKPLTIGETYNDKAITAVYTGFETAKYTSENNVPWYKDGNYQNIEIVTFEEIIKPQSTAYWFYKFSNLISIDLEKLDTTNVTIMTSMFRGCSSLKELDLSHFNTSKVTEMNKPWNYSKGMFGGCSSLQYLDVSSFDTSKLQYFANMFSGCSNLVELDISNFNTGLATDMYGMFSGCSSLTSLDVSNFGTGSVYNMGYMFRYCYELLELDVSNWDTSSVTSMYMMFDGCNNLRNIDVSKFNTVKVTTLRFMFRNCYELLELDVSNWDTSSVDDMGYLFMSCNNLIELDVSGWNTSKVTDMRYMFYGCDKIDNLDVSTWNTSNVTSMNRMFAGCSNLVELDISNFNTGLATDMYGMFSGCRSLTSLDVSNFDTSKVNDMGSMFKDCTTLTTTITIRNVSVTAYSNMLTGAATAKDSDGNYISQITIKYVPDDSTTETNESTEAIVDAMIATKSSNSNVIKGCYGDYCPTET